MGGEVAFLKPEQDPGKRAFVAENQLLISLILAIGWIPPANATPQAGLRKPASGELSFAKLPRQLPSASCF